MKIKLKKNIFIKLIIIIILLSFIVFLKNPIVNFGFAMLIFISIARYAKFSFFTEMSLILTFSYLQGVIYKTFGKIEGSTLAWAGVKMPFYFDDLSIATISFLIVTFCFVSMTSIVELEKNIYKRTLNLNKFTTLIYVSFACVLVLLIFPSKPTLNFSDGMRARNESLPYGFILLALVLLCISFDSVKQIKGLWIAYIFVIFWIFGHGERVEILGFLSYIALKFINSQNGYSIKEKVSIKRKERVVVLLGVLIVLLAILIGMKRQSVLIDISIKTILYNVIIQPTCGDVVYCFNAAANLWHTNQGLMGYTYIDYLLQLIPASSSKYSAAAILVNRCNTMGGALFFAEPMMNFGIIGVIVFNIEFFITMYFILRKTAEIRSWIWVPIVVEVFRICWYGRLGWILVSLVEIPLIFWGTKYFLNRIKI